MGPDYSCYFGGEKNPNFAKNYENITSKQLTSKSSVHLYGLFIYLFISFLACKGKTNQIYHIQHYYRECAMLNKKEAKMKQDNIRNSHLLKCRGIHEDLQQCL